MTTFTVIIPNRNTPGVERAVAAAAAQTLPAGQFDVIVVGVDDAGRVPEGERVRFDRASAPLAPAQARNRGAAQASGEVLAFTDADCVPRPDWLAVLAERFADPAVSVVGGGVTFRAGSYWGLADNLSMFYEHLAGLPAGTRSILPSLNLAVRRKAFWEAGGFDERYPRASGEDAELCLRLRRHGHTLHFEPRAIVEHAPPRHRAADLLRHAYYQGMYSTKVDSRYPEAALPWPARERWALVLGAPLLATGALARLWGSPAVRRHWPTLPALWLAKVAWCLGAARHPAWPAAAPAGPGGRVRSGLA